MPNFPNRCQHIKINGTLCGSPALRRNRFCYFHKLHQEETIQLNTDRTRRKRSLAITLPVLEDANSIQISLMQIMRLIISGQIDGKTAGLLLYALQTASSNLPRTNFQPYLHEVVLDPKTVHEAPLGGLIWKNEDFLDDVEEDQEEDETSREGFVPRTPEEARNQAELTRWAEAEADRLSAIGARQDKAERQAELREDQLEAAREEAERAGTTAPKAASPAAAITPAARAVLPPAPTATTARKRPPANVSMDEVRKKVTAQIKKALPAIAAATAQASRERSRTENGNNAG
jgi:hypothetical protein